MSIRAALDAAKAGRDVEPEVLSAAFDKIMRGEGDEKEIADLLLALKEKGESVSEIVAVARVLRAHAETARALDPRTIDTCGTGGSGVDTFSISTTTAFVVAGAGVSVAKHGNRAASSLTGSFDTFEALGVVIDHPIEVCARILAEVGIAPFYARTAHPAFRHLAPVRQKLGVRTILNCLGPLLNPVGAQYQLMGVYDGDLVEPMARALGELGARRAMVVHGSDGLDELTITGKSSAALLDDGEVRLLEIEPEQCDLPRAASGIELVGGNAKTNAEILRKILDKEIFGPRRDIVLLNAAAALWVVEKAKDLEEGVVLAAESIDSGAARKRLDELVRVSQEIV